MKTIAQQLNVTKFPFEIKNHNGKLIYREDSDGYWYKWQYNTNGNKIYYETSYGRIIDNRPKEIIVSMDEIADKMGIPVSQLKIKKE